MINVLAAALNCIPLQQITYKKYINRRVNSMGIVRNIYSDPITVAGSIQPVDAETVYKLGIANSDDVYICWLHGNALSVSKMLSNDIIIGADGAIYNIFKSDKWSDYPGQDWNRVLLRRAKDYV